MVNEQPLDVEVWALNDCYSFVQRPWDRWFEVHAESIWRPMDGPKHDEFLRTGVSPFQETCVPREGSRIHMLWGTRYGNRPVPKDEYPLAEPYPFEAIEEAFGRANNKDHPYLTSSIDYMLALAVLEGYDEIRVYGINHATTTEFTHQRPACEYWLGVAMGRGIRVVVPEDCPLLQAPLYGPKRKGFVDGPRLETRRDRLRYEMEQVRQVAMQLEGAAQTADEVKRRLAMIEGMPGEASEMVEALLTEVVNKRVNTEGEFKAVRGAVQVIEQLLGLVNEPDLESSVATPGPVAEDAPRHAGGIKGRISSVNGHAKGEKVELPA
jgi:hypothetical protein